jgi:hypothetical protein
LALLSRCLADDQLTALNLLCDAVEASLSFALHVAAVDGIAGQPCDPTAITIGIGCSGDDCATVARQLRDS